MIHANNNVNESGNVADEPRLTTATGNGADCCTFRLAVDSVPPGRKTNFFAVRVYGRYAATVHGLIAKGSRVSILGRLDSRPANNLFDRDGRPVTRDEVFIVAVSVVTHHRTSEGA